MPLKFLMQTSHTSSKIQYKPLVNRTFTPFINKHLLSSCSTTINFAKLITLSIVLTAAVTWCLRHTTVTCHTMLSTAIKLVQT